MPPRSKRQRKTRNLNSLRAKKSKAGGGVGVYAAVVTNGGEVVMAANAADGGAPDLLPDEDSNAFILRAASAKGAASTTGAANWSGSSGRRLGPAPRF